MIRNGDKVILGVSGGPDSMAMLNLFLELHNLYRIKIIVAHQICYFSEKHKNLDKSYAKMVEKFCLAKGLTFKSSIVDLIKENNKESRARDERYKFFEKLLREEKANKIALAHNLDDNRETVFMNLIRGTGILGLAGIPYKRGFYIRPCLDISKKELLQYCENKKIPFITDYANSFAEPLRNKIRNKAMPFLKKEVSSDFGISFDNLSRLMKDASLYLENESAKKEKEIKIAQDNYSLKKWTKLESFMRLEVLRRIINEKATLKDVGYKHLKELESLLLYSPTGSSKEICNDLILSKSYNSFKIDKAITKNVLCETKKLKTGKNSFNDSFLIVSKTKNTKRLSKDSNVLMADFDKIVFPLSIRIPQNGDKFMPLGMKNLKKLQDFFIDIKIHRDERKSISLIVDASENIVWICGIRMDERYKITKKTRSILRIEFGPIKS